METILQNEAENSSSLSSMMETVLDFGRPSISGSI
jgi:hypothetical protein